MNRMEAIAEARRRWGQFGGVTTMHPTNSRALCGVGYMAGPIFRAMGKGCNWKSAFADADRKRKQKTRKVG